MMREPCERCGSRAAQCPHYPAAVDGFDARVALAARCIRTGDGIGSRAFDNCFEMCDGDAVVMALEYLARRDDALRAGMARVWDNGPSREGYDRTVAAMQSVAEHDLPRVARALRDAGAGAHATPDAQPETRDQLMIRLRLAAPKRPHGGQHSADVVGLPLFQSEMML